MSLLLLAVVTVALWAVLQLVPEIQDPKWQRVVRLVLLIVFLIWLVYSSLNSGDLRTGR